MGYGSELKITVEPNSVDLEYGDRLYCVVSREYRHFNSICPVCDDTRKITVRGYEMDCPYCRYNKGEQGTHIQVVRLEVVEYIVNEICILGPCAKNAYQKKLPTPVIYKYKAFTRTGRSDYDVETTTPPNMIEYYDVPFEKKSSKIKIDNIKHYYWRDKNEAQKFCDYFIQMQKEQLAEFNRNNKTEHVFPF